MPYCLYVRKSRADADAEARGEGETLSRHIHTLLELAKKRNLDILQIHKEIVSGETIAARPVMQQLLLEVERGMWDGVLVMEVERLARGDTIDQGIVAQTFKFSGTKIITPLKDYNPENEFDEEYFEFGLFMSRREYKTINRRLQRGRTASVNEGKWVGNKTPYGYGRVKIPNDKGFTLEPIPDEAEIVQMIYSLYTKGETLSDGSCRRLGVCLIARRLNSMGIPPRNSPHWSPATLRGILTNPVYIGKVRWNNRACIKHMEEGKVTVSRPRANPNDCILADGLHPPIIDADTFSLAQEYMSENPPRPVGERNTVTNPLAGLVVCAKCGHHMVRRPYSSGKTPDTLLCAQTSCDNISSYLSHVEQRILDSLQEWLDGYRLQWEADTQTQSDTAVKERALKTLLNEEKTLRTQLDRTHDLLEQGIYTTDDFLDRSRKLSERIRKNADDRAALQDEIEKDHLREQSKTQIIPKIEHLLEVYHSLPNAKAKNDILKEVLEKVVYLKAEGGRWNKNNDRFEITIYPKIPRT